MLSWTKCRMRSCSKRHFALVKQPCRHAALTVEPLEGRDCPAAPVISNFTATPLNYGRWVELQGTVFDENPSAVSVSLTGSVSGNPVVGANGAFSIVTEAATLGAVFAQALDDESLYSDLAETAILSLQPSVSVQLLLGAGRNVIVFGTVSDEEPGQRMVNFSGMAAGSVLTDASGAFSFATEATGLGTIVASTTDIWGQTSVPTLVTIASDVPSISSLIVSEAGGGAFTVSGTIVDDDPASASIGLSGVLAVSLSVSADGSFAYTGQPSNLGAIQAAAVDTWGQSSATVQTAMISSAPSIAALNIVLGAGRAVTISGTITDEDAEATTIAFSGVVSGAVAVNPTGSFSFTAEAAALGDVQAVAQDRWGQNSSPAIVAVASNPPQIVDFEAIYIGGGVWEFRGRVIGEHAANQDVILGGLPSLDGQTTTDENGNFSYQAQLPAGESGEATATTTDPYGQQSNTASAPVNQDPPSVSFDYELGSGGVITITGVVSDDDPGSCTIAFSGIVDDSVGVNPDGTFTFSTEVTTLGTIIVIAIDACDHSSLPDEFELTSIVPTIGSPAISYVSGRLVTVSGQVSDEFPAMTTVTLSGAVQGSVAPSVDGTFSFTAEASGLGQIEIVATDAWGLNSNVALLSVANNVPILGALSVAYGAGRWATISGAVTDEEPSSCTVGFSGMITGTAAVGSDGTFSFTGEATGLGDVQASAQDVWSQNSTQFTATLGPEPSEIVGFMAIELASGLWEFRGQVIGIDPDEQSVHLDGLPSLSGQVVITDSNGYFAVQIQLGVEESGTATATTIDSWGQYSDVASAIVEPSW